MTKLLFTIPFCLLATFAIAQDYYVVETIRAKPGGLLELIDLFKEDIKRADRYDIQKPYLMRHSQGDHWDLMLIYPMGKSIDDHFKSSAIKKRRKSNTLDQEYDSKYFDLISFQEEQIVKGPDIEEFNRRFSEFDYYHIEIFQALAGKRAELLKEREMENVYLRGINRDDNLIFTKVFGGEADTFTIGFYRDIKHYAESAYIPIETENEAAKRAGFKSVYTIGSYLRSLILRHNDTLANAVRE